MCPTNKVGFHPQLESQNCYPAEFLPAPCPRPYPLPPRGSRPPNFSSTSVDWEGKRGELAGVHSCNFPFLCHKLFLLVCLPCWASCFQGKDGPFVFQNELFGLVSASNSLTCLPLGAHSNSDEQAGFQVPVPSHLYLDRVPASHTLLLLNCWEQPRFSFILKS